MIRRSAWILAVVLTAAPLAAQNLSTSPRAPVPRRTEAAAEAPPRRPTTFGTEQVTYVQIPPNAFQPHRSDQTYQSDNFGLGPRWPTGITHDLTAPVQLPAGARVVSLELAYEDSNPTDYVLGTLAVCNFQGEDCVLHPATGSGPPDCTFAGFICSGIAAAGGLGSRTADLSIDNITVDNFFRQYTVLAEPTESDGSVKIAGMTVGYVLQVSPAPAMPTFNDVPTNDFGYQYIEALSLSGITGGCQAAPPLFCPDAFVTRRQMAIFLAKALGLQWPHVFF